MKLRHLPLIAAIGLFSTVTLAAGYTATGPLDEVVADLAAALGDSH